MSDHAAMIRDLYAAFGRGDIPAVLGALAEDASWTEAEGFPYGGTYIGPAAILDGVFMRLGGEWDGFAAVAHEVIDGGETVVGLGEYSGTYKATGKFFRAPFAHVWRVHDGRITRFMQYTDTALVQRALQA